MHTTYGRVQNPTHVGHRDVGEVVRAGTIMLFNAVVTIIPFRIADEIDKYLVCWRKYQDLEGYCNSEV